MKALIALLQIKKVLYPAVAGAVLVGATAVNAATGGTVLGPITGTSSSPASTLGSSGTTAAASPTPTGTATVSPQDAPTTDADSENFGGGGGKNQVRVVNQEDNTLRIVGRIQLNHIDGPTAAPENFADAYSSCRQCQTLAVALQINLISTSTSDVRPQNAAVALNYQCTGCTTVAKALQYNLSVPDPNRTASDVRDLVHAMKAELQRLRTEPGLTIDQAEAQVNSVITQFQQLEQYLHTRQQTNTNSTSPSVTPLPSPTVTATGTATATPSATASVTPSPTATDTPTPTVTPTATATATP